MYNFGLCAYEVSFLDILSDFGTSTCTIFKSWHHLLRLLAVKIYQKMPMFDFKIKQEIYIPNA